MVVSALNRNGEEITLEGEGLLARAFCHEIDHLDGVLFSDKAIRFIDVEEIRKNAKGGGKRARRSRRTRRIRRII